MLTNLTEKVNQAIAIKSTGKRSNKKDIYAAFGIEYADGKIRNSLFGWIEPLLINGNDKLGKGVYTWSMLPTNEVFNININGSDYCVKGTCNCHCEGCYATTGRYNCDNVKEANAKKTILARSQLDWVRNAIIAQIIADGIKIIRIHAAGDFFGPEYIEAWKTICSVTPNTVYWTYTKNHDAENAFDGIDNINVVRSIIPGYGFNFGHCDYIIKVYHALKAIGKKVYICRCGIDKNQHCTNCHGCIENEVVLFVEHSTSYRAEKDPAYNELKQLIESQDK
jgi:hypothetical protein